MVGKKKSLQKSKRPRRKTKSFSKSANDKPDQSRPSDVFPIIGIGASAGGLEAYIELFKLLPPDTGMAFVLVQHLSPKHFSMLSEIIQKTTRMDVQEAKDATKILPNNVYVIPPNSIMEVFHGVLHLRPMNQPHSTNRLVDIFFRSLAYDHRNLAVGIVLSGTGSDGAQGLRDIKAEGGISFIQDPATAKFDGMPRMAMELDHPDKVLPIAALAKELVKITFKPNARVFALDASALTPENEAYLKQIFILVRSLTGTDFSTYKTPTIIRRIKRRMVLHRIDSLKHYHSFLESSKEEVKALFGDLLINVTEFFRNPEVFDALKTKVFPEILRDRAEGEAIRLWVPGCSTGEEVYSIAITLLEYLGKSAAKFPVQIYGTDISDDIVKKARAGLFPEAISKQISDERLSRFFIKEPNGYRVSPTVRQCCIFSTQDVTADPPIHRLDILSCRNLMIYLGPSVQQRLMENFFYALKPTGFLLLGASESVGTAASLFAIVDDKTKIYLKRATAAPPRRFLGKLKEPNPVPKGADDTSHTNLASDPIALAEKIVLERYAPASILVNQAMDIVQFTGNTTHFISHKSGQPSWNLFKMLRDDLVTEIRVLLHSAQKEKIVAKKVGLQFKSGSKSRLLDLVAIPIATARIDAHYLVLFFVRALPQKSGEKIPARDEKQVSELKQELAATKSSLRSFMEEQNATNEELQSANEEILSANEELQSTNEELETAKEELQSTNEELVTLNDELSNRNSELTEANNDLSNVLSNAHGAIVIVGASMQIRRITPAAAKLLNIGLNDIGRKLMDFNLGFPTDVIEEKLTDAVRNVSTLEFELRNRAGNYYLIRIRPYKTVDNRIEGAVATFIDIDDLKTKERGILATQRYSNAIIQTMHDSLLVIDGSLRIQNANRAFYKTFRVDESATLGKLLYELGNGQWDIPELRKLLEEILPKKVEIEAFKVTHDFEHIGKQTMLINAQRLVWEHQKEILILLAIRRVADEDISKT